jgi:hypothetical protein
MLVFFFSFKTFLKKEKQVASFLKKKFAALFFQK